MFEPDELWSLLEANEKEIRQGLTKELISERARQNLTMVYKVQVTPTRILFHGPEPEAKNRILRKFPRHTEYFARVQFCDEDGQDISFNSKGELTSQESVTYFPSHSFSSTVTSYQDLRNETYCTIIVPLVSCNEYLDQLCVLYPSTLHKLLVGDCSCTGLWTSDTADAIRHWVVG